MNEDTANPDGAYLAQSDARFRAVFEDAAIGITIVDLSGHPVKCNPALERILGYKEAELRGMAFPEFTHPDDVQKDLDLYRSLVAGERDYYQIEKRYIRKDARTVWARLTISLVHEQANAPRFAIGMVEDITAQKLAQEALRDSDEKFFKAFNGNPSPTLITRAADGRVLEANQAFTEWFGVSAAEAREKTAFDFGFWKSAEERAELLRAVYEKGALRNYQKVIVLPSGEKRTALLSIQPLSIRNEECLLAISTDITQQKQAEEALQRSEERLRRGLDAARTGTWEWDVPTGEVTWNAGVPALFGLRPGEFGGTIDAFFHLVDVQDRERARREINDSLEDPKRDYCSEIRVRWPDGNVHWLEGRGEVLRDSTGKPKTMLGTVVDITDRKRTELALRGSEQSLREAQERELHSRQEFTRQLLEAEEQERQRLAAELHDSLGQTLSMIKNHTFLAQERPGLPAAVLEHLNSISRFADETIAEVRDLVRNLRPIQIEQLGLTDSVRELVDRIQQSSSLRLERRIENVDDVIHGEASTHLYRIVQEALNNLIKHSAASRADFCLERDINCVRLRLFDDGAGFDVRQSSLHGGFGLRNIAERAQMLGGSLKIQSTPGTGTRLIVEVPIRDEAGAEP